MTSYRGRAVRLTVAQALVRFLAAQEVERDGERHLFFAGCLGIFGHGNVAGLGQALLEAGDDLPYYLARNEQAMVHTAVGYARMSDRLRAFACTTSIGPGATNLVTGAAVATTNRIPVLLLPGDVFATRRANPVLQELEDPTSLDVSVNDCLRPVSRYFDRVWRPEQLPAALLNAMRVLTDPAETGAVTLALPQDLATEAFEVPDGLTRAHAYGASGARRPSPSSSTPSPRWSVRRSAPSSSPGAGSSTRARPRRSAAWPTRPDCPSPRPRQARARCATTIRRAWGRSARPGRRAANEIARDADLVIGVGTRWSDFTTASHSAFQDAAGEIRQRQRDAVRHHQARRPAGGRRRPCRARGPRRPTGRLAGRPGVRGAVSRARREVERDCRGCLCRCGTRRSARPR